MPTPTDRPLKVFLCHAHSDAARVRVLYDELRRSGIDVWLDKEKLIPGSDWDAEIRKAVRAADVVMVCLSRDFHAAGYRQKEVRLALDTAMEKPADSIFIIPARLEECENLESLTRWQWVDLYAPNGYQNLLRALRMRAESLGTTVRTRREILSNTITNDPRQSSEFTKPYEPTKQDVGNETIVEPVLKHVPEAANASKENASVTTPDSDSKSDPLQSCLGLVLIIAFIAVLGLMKNWDETRQGVPKTATASFLTSIVQGPGVYPIVIASHGSPMNLVPAGDFTMGMNLNDAIARCSVLDDYCPTSRFIDQTPARRVTLGNYYIDTYEVSFKAYAECVNAGACEPPRSLLFAEPTDYPVAYVNWNAARVYCEWRGARLPSEAEWEKAARGPLQQIFPWGNEDILLSPLKCSYANFAGCKTASDRVGMNTRDKSIYGVYDLAGNLMEWVDDIYRVDAYGFSPATQTEVPTTPEVNPMRVVRGGSWISSLFESTTTYRNHQNEDTNADNLGFRCAKDAN